MQKREGKLIVLGVTLTIIATMNNLLMVSGSQTENSEPFRTYNNTAYVLTFTAIPESFATYLPTFEKMLQSFNIPN